MKVTVEADFAQRVLDVVAAADVRRAAVAIEHGAEAGARGVHLCDVLFNAAQFLKRNSFAMRAQPFPWTGCFD